MSDSGPCVFVDTTVLLYSEDQADPSRQRRALAWLRELWQRRSGRISTQVLDEFYLLATQRIQPPMPAGDARAEVRRYQLWQPWQTDRATVESAWALESRHGLHYRDCLIVAAAQHLGCRYLLSGELPEGQHYGAVQTIHPTTASVSLLGPLP